MIYKKIIFQIKSEYVCEMMEEDLEIKDCEYDVGEVNLINWENILKHNKDIKYRYIQVSKSKSCHYNIMVKKFRGVHRSRTGPDWLDRGSKNCQMVDQGPNRSGFNPNQTRPDRIQTGPMAAKAIRQ